MRVTLLGLEFAIENMGCQALAYSFASLFDECAKKQNTEVEYVAVVFRGFSDVIVNEKHIGCLEIRVKKVHFWSSIWETFKKSDLIVDFTGGDSFSDIYGLKRFIIGSTIKGIAIASGTKFMLGPQTYGPYEKCFSRFWARQIIKKSEWVFARDAISQQYAKSLSGREVILTTDVAFSLPFHKIAVKTDVPRIGFNISGLLWNGGYTNAPIEMTVDYQTYCREVIHRLISDNNSEVHLIPHVGVVKDDMLENDLNVCLLLKKEFPQVIVEQNIKSPMDAKDIIASMDVFVGARMHATIAAFSSGVATIPFSYSRKFEGLYGSLGYNYIISAQTCSTGKAINDTLEWINDCSGLLEAVKESGEKISILQKSFENTLLEILEKIKDD